MMPKNIAYHIEEYRCAKISGNHTPLLHHEARINLEKILHT